MSIARGKNVGGSGTLGVPMVELPIAVQVKLASNVAGMLMNRQIGWCCRWFNRDSRIASSIVSVFVPWSLRARAVGEGLVVRWVGLMPSPIRTLLKFLCPL